MRAVFVIGEKREGKVGTGICFAKWGDGNRARRRGGGTNVQTTPDMSGGDRVKKRTFASACVFFFV